MKPLDGIRILSLAINIPGPVAAARLHQLGAAVVKIEPPAGDPLAIACRPWYDALHQGITIHSLNLKTEAGQAALHDHLQASDLLLTAQRPSALARLGLDWPTLAGRYPQLCQVAIVGYPAPGDEIPGHDLTYQAGLGLLTPPHLPRTVLADLAGAEWAVDAALAMLLARRIHDACDPADRYLQLSLAEAAGAFAAPLRYGLTAPGGILGGGLPGYNLYPAKSGWVAVAALEPHFWLNLIAALGLEAGAPTPDIQDQLARIFVQQPAAAWEAWAAERDLPLSAVKLTPNEGEYHA
jgi:alpha-methylacyl-CoA racemase